MSATANAWAKDVLRLNPHIEPSDKRTLQCMARAHSADKGRAVRSYHDIASATQDNIRTVKRSVDRLVDLGLIEKLHQRKGRRQGPNAYLLNMGVLRVSRCHSERPASGCHHQTPDLVSPCHPEEFRQSVTVTPPNARAGAPIETNGILKVVGGRNV